MRSAATWRTYRTSGTGSSTIMDSETSNSSSPARTMQRSPTSQPSSPLKCADSRWLRMSSRARRSIGPELRIYPRRELAVRLGVSTESLSETIRVATIGDVGPALAKFDAGDRTIPIRVLLEENARADQQVLEQIRVPSQRGVGVPLVALADISFGEGADQYRSLRSSAAGQRRGGSRRRCCAQRCARGHQSAAGHEEISRPASRSAKAAMPSSRPSCSTDSAGPCAMA